MAADSEVALAVFDSALGEAEFLTVGSELVKEDMGSCWMETSWRQAFEKKLR